MAVKTGWIEGNNPLASNGVVSIRHVEASLEDLVLHFSEDSLLITTSHCMQLLPW